ncbi:hypothetical protein LAZ40_09930 [Cereibacter sphaeroides]|uniref:hypothetical protein n=1 Tax=Cereibacter sphaeroides TaxID=1063 RepID=UPI001F37B903|nr:hypothetical protein [Cereibacter sphaeroides]MCE6959370.1 hypothetical protein [Cereibacter sphaeroides]MCE6972962.1 hypothetical protein [Cereibacter sphaeroides]
MRNELAAARRMDGPELAAWLLGLARSLRDSGKFNTDPTYSYDEWALFRVIPEMALRLDPAAKLRPEEIPDPAEAADRVTWLKDADPARLAEMVGSILDNASFRRGMLPDAGPEAGRAAKLLHFYRRDSGPLGIALERLAGRTPAIEAEDERPPLPGLYLVGEKDRHDTVLRYCETTAEMIETHAAVMASLGGEELDDGQAVIVDRVLRFRADRLSSFSAITIQDFEGNRIPVDELKAGCEAAPAL